MRLSFPFLACLALAGSPVFAASCVDLPTETETRLCAAAELDQADQALNKTYAKYRSGLDESQKRQLKEVQLAWIRFRDLSCRFESSGVEGGSIHGFILNTCLTGMTRDRTRRLQALLDCKEGDLSCPPVIPSGSR